MSVRIIKTVSPQNQNPIQSIETEATTFGELKRDLDAAGVQYTGMAITVKSNKVSLDLDDAVIPEGDQVLYITPTKVKSGYFTEEQFEDMWSDDQKRAAFSQALEADLARLMTAIETLVRGVQAQAAAVQSAPVVVVSTPVVTPEPVKPSISAEDQALLDEASSLYSTSSYDEDEEEDSDDY